jgi:hypothetical protein
MSERRPMLEKEPEKEQKEPDEELIEKAILLIYEVDKEKPGAKEAEKEFKSQHPLEYTLGEMERDRSAAIHVMLADREPKSGRPSAIFGKHATTYFEGNQRPEYFEEIERRFGAGTIQRIRTGKKKQDIEYRIDWRENKFVKEQVGESLKR